MEKIIGLPLYNGNIGAFRGGNYIAPAYVCGLRSMFDHALLQNTFNKVLITDYNACLGKDIDNSDEIGMLLKTYPNIKFYLRNNPLTYTEVARWYDLGIYGIVIDSMLDTYSPNHAVNTVLNRFPDTIIALDFIPLNDEQLWTYYSNKGFQITSKRIQDVYAQLSLAGNLLITNTSKAGSRRGHWSPDKFWSKEKVWYAGGVDDYLDERSSLTLKGYDGVVVTTAVYK